MNVCGVSPVSMFLFDITCNAPVNLANVSSSFAGKDVVAHYARSIFYPDRCVHVVRCTLYIVSCMLNIVYCTLYCTVLWHQSCSYSWSSCIFAGYHHHRFPHYFQHTYPQIKEPWSSRTNRLRIKYQGSRIKDQMWESASFIHSGKDGLRCTIHLTLLAKCRFQRGRVWSKVGTGQKQFPSQGEKGSDIYIGYFTYFE